MCKLLMDELMSEESTSDLAYNIFTKGKHNSYIVEYMESENITCPEDLFKKLRMDNIRSMNARYPARYTKKDIGEYHFRKNELSLIELIKKMSCWMFQSCDDERVIKGKLFKTLEKFKQDACTQYVYNTEEYKNAKWE